MDEFLRWLSTATPAILPVLVLAIPGTLVALVGELFARLRERRAVRIVVHSARSDVLQKALAYLVELAEAKANPEGNVGRAGPAAAAARVAIANLSAVLRPRDAAIAKWLELVRRRFATTDLRWLDLDQLDSNLVDPIVLWQRGELRAAWFADRLKESPFLPGQIHDRGTLR